MKQLLIVLMLWVTSALAQPVIQPATQAQVDAGVLTTPYVSPATLKNWTGGGGGGGGGSGVNTNTLNVFGFGTVVVDQFYWNVTPTLYTNNQTDTVLTNVNGMWWFTNSTTLGAVYSNTALISCDWKRGTGDLPLGCVEFGESAIATEEGFGLFTTLNNGTNFDMTAISSDGTIPAITVEGPVQFNGDVVVKSDGADSLSFGEVGGGNAVLNAQALNAYEVTITNALIWASTSDALFGAPGHLQIGDVAGNPVIIMDGHNGIVDYYFRGTQTNDGNGDNVYQIMFGNANHFELDGVYIDGSNNPQSADAIDCSGLTWTLSTWDSTGNLYPWVTIDHGMATFTNIVVNGPLAVNGDAVVQNSLTAGSITNLGSYFSPDWALTETPTNLLATYTNNTSYAFNTNAPMYPNDVATVGFVQAFGATNKVSTIVSGANLTNAVLYQGSPVGVLAYDSTAGIVYNSNGNSVFNANQSRVNDQFGVNSVDGAGHNLNLGPWTENNALILTNNTGTAYVFNGSGVTNISAANISHTITRTNWTANFYTNTTGSSLTFYADEAVTSAASVGNTGFQVLYDPAGGHAWQTNCDGSFASVTLSIAGMVAPFRLSGPWANGGVILFTNVSTVGTAVLKNGYFSN